MRLAPIVLSGLLLLGSPARPAAAQQVNLGILIGKHGVSSFHLAIGQYYQVPEAQVVVVERSIPQEEMPVVFYLAQQAHVAPVEVVKLRLAGSSWLHIGLQLGLRPEVFYVPVKETVVVAGSPYGVALGYYWHRPRAEWMHIVLTDEQVVGLVNLRFMSDHYRLPPEQVIRLRVQSGNFVVLHDRLGGHRNDRRSWSGRGRGHDDYDDRHDRDHDR